MTGDDQPHVDPLELERWRGEMSARVKGHDREVKALRDTLATKDQVQGLEKALLDRFAALGKSVTTSVEGVTKRFEDRGKSCDGRFAKLSGDIEEAEAGCATRVSGVTDRLDTEVLPKLQTGEIQHAVTKATLGFWVKVVLVLFGTSISGGGVLLLGLKLAGYLQG